MSQAYIQIQKPRNYDTERNKIFLWIDSFVLFLEVRIFWDIIIFSVNENNVKLYLQNVWVKTDYLFCWNKY